MTPKTTWLQMLALSLICFAILSGCKQQQGNVNPVSQMITKAEVKALTDAYKADGRHLMRQDPAHPNDTTKKIPVTGFIFDADQIREVVNNNMSGQRADHVLVLFGLDKKTNQWHTIIMGTSNRQLLDYNKDDSTAANVSVYHISVPDKAVPCPPCDSLVNFPHWTY